MKKLYAEVMLDNDELERIGSNYPIKLEYYKTINETEKEYNTFYGIEVVKRVNLEERMELEAKHIKNVCNCEYLTNSILERLKNNLVTPSALEDVTEDLMKEYGISEYGISE